VNAAALAFLAGALGAIALAFAVPPGSLARFARRPGGRGRRRSGAGGSRGSGARGARLLGALAALGRRLGPVARAQAPRELSTRIAAAGLGGPAGGALARLDARELMAAKLAAGALGATLGTALGAIAPGRLGLLLVVAGPLAGFLAPDVWLVRRARERARRVRRELPAMLDLLRVTVEAGLSLTASLTAVGARTRGTLGAEWQVVGREVALGVPVGEALAAMSARVPIPEIRALLGALERSVKHGAPLAETLAAQARDARASRGRRIREEAAQAGPKIQLAVALLLVPSVLLMVAAALAAALIGGDVVSFA